MTTAHACWLHDTGTPLPPELSQQLTDAERTELARFRLPDRSRSFILSRVMLRQLLRQLLAGNDSSPVLDRTASGRLTLMSPPGWHISVSHCPGHVAVMAAHAPCGIDVEINRDADWKRIARRYFSEAENDYLQQLEATRGAEDFLKLWTLKEAGVKAMGTGLAGNLSRLAFDIRGNSASPQPSSVPGMRTHLQQMASCTLAMALLTNKKASWHVCELALEDLLTVSG